METGLLTFGEIRSHAANFVQEPSVNFDSMLATQVNDDLELASQKIVWPQLFAYSRGTLTMTAGSPTFYCPKDVETPLELVDETNKVRLEPMNYRAIFQKYAGTYSANSNAFAWSTMADSPIKADFLAAGEKIQIVSSSSADTSKAVRVVYRNTNKDILDESIVTNASNGTTAVQSSATMFGIVRISTSASRVGVITVSGVTSGTTYATIGPRETASIYKVLFLTNFPASANAVTLVYSRGVQRLVNDDDVPEIPVSQHLRKKAISFAMRWMGKTQEAEVWERDAQQDLESCIGLSQDPSTTVSSPVPRRFRYNQFRYGTGWRGGWISGP